MVAIGIGDRMVMMQGHSRQKAISNDPTKKGRSVSFRRYVVPSETRESLSARAALADAAIAMRGRSFEEVITNVIQQTAGRDHGGKAKAARLKQARYLLADANVARMKALLSGGAPALTPTGIPGLF